MADSGDTHMKAAKRVLRYLKGTWDLGLRFTRPERETSSISCGDMLTPVGLDALIRESRQPDMCYGSMEQLFPGNRKDKT